MIHIRAKPKKKEQKNNTKKEKAKRQFFLTDINNEKY